MLVINDNIIFHVVLCSISAIIAGISFLGYKVSKKLTHITWLDYLTRIDIFSLNHFKDRQIIFINNFKNKSQALNSEAKLSDFD